MKRILMLSVLMLSVIGLSLSPAPTLAALVDIYVDAAPNKYGSPDYDAWEANAFSAAASGTFVNMANSINPANTGTTNFEAQDEVVYSFGDLGKRLTFIYFVPNKSIAELPELDFAVSMTNEQNGVVTDVYLNRNSSTWLQPTQWQDYDSNKDGTPEGVIGAAGEAWWGAYKVNIQAALDADIANLSLIEEAYTFSVRMDGEIYSLEANRAAVPLPPAIILLGSGLIGLVGFRRKIRNSFTRGGLIITLYDGV